MPCPIATSLSLPRSACLLLAASLGALGFVFVMQYGFGLHPCVLCLWQRIPYAIVGVLSAALVFLKPRKNLAVALLALCSVAFLAGMGLGIFHTGVELHWWLGTSGCAVHPVAGGSVDDMRESLLQTMTPRCDEIAWTLFGLSMANYNIAASLILAFFAAACAAKSAEKG